MISADSQIGQAMLAALSERGYEHTATSRRIDSKWHPFNLLNPWGRLPIASVTYLGSGINGFADCAADVLKSWHINVDGNRRAATQQVNRGGRVVFLSSCAVETHPHTVYGALKRHTEEVMATYGDQAAWYRFGPVMFPGRNCYPNQAYHPISLDDLCAVLIDAIDYWRPGLHRVHNEGRLYDLDR